MIKYFYVIVLSLLLVGCKTESVNLEERVSFWESSLNKNLPIGTNKSIIENWLSEYDFKITHDVKENSYHGILETVKGDGIVCSEWVIMAKVQLDAENKVKNTEVNKAGVCL